MSENKKSVAGRLYYTFGTVFLMAVITVCAMNFLQDSRIMSRAAATASAEPTAAKPVISADTEQTEIEQTKDKQTKTEQTKTEQNKSKKDVTVDGSGSGTNKKTQVNPGEEP